MSDPGKVVYSSPGDPEGMVLTLVAATERDPAMLAVTDGPPAGVTNPADLADRPTAVFAELPNDPGEATNLATAVLASTGTAGTVVTTESTAALTTAVADVIRDAAEAQQTPTDAAVAVLAYLAGRNPAGRPRPAVGGDGHHRATALAVPDRADQPPDPSRRLSSEAHRIHGTAVAGGRGDLP